MESEWELKRETTVTKAFAGFGKVNVVVSITGLNWKDVHAAHEEVDARLSADLEEGRFDVRKLGVFGALTALLVENKALNRNLSAVQDRSGKILQYARDAHDRIVGLLRVRTALEELVRTLPEMTEADLEDLEDLAAGPLRVLEKVGGEVPADPNRVR